MMKNNGKLWKIMKNYEKMKNYGKTVKNNREIMKSNEKR